MHNTFKDETRKIIYTNKEMLELLQVNNATLKKYRDGGYLGYSKIGDKYLYSMSDIQAFLKNTHYEPYLFS